MLQNNGVRISQIISHFCGSKANFARKIGESYNTVSNWVSRDNGKSVLDKVISNFPEVNPTWLIIGEGEMLREASPQVLVDVTPQRPLEFDYSVDESGLIQMELKTSKKAARELASKVAELNIENETLKARLASALAELRTLRGAKTSSQLLVKSSDTRAVVQAEPQSSVPIK